MKQETSLCQRSDEQNVFVRMKISVIGAPLLGPQRDAEAHIQGWVCVKHTHAPLPLKDEHTRLCARFLRVRPRFPLCLIYQLQDGGQNESRTNCCTIVAFLKGRNTHYKR